MVAQYRCRRYVLELRKPGGGRNQARTAAALLRLDRRLLECRRNLRPRGQMNSTFPAEIFSIILTELGSPERRILCSLLVVSRQFHALIIPLLYESITLPSHMMEYRVHTFGPETTIPTPAHFSKFVTTICHNPALAAHIVSFINDDTSDSSLIDWVLLARAVTQLTHLKKLYISNMIAAENMSLLPPSASLTHLFLGGLLSSTAYKFVYSQPSLQHVNLGPASEEGALDELPSIALPNLVTLECHEDFFAKLDGSSPPPMENLCIRSVRTAPPMEGMQSRIVRNVRTLSLSCRTFKKIVSWCERVEFLSITSESVDVDTILFIPSPALKYLRTANIILSLEDVDRIFAAFPNLGVVDIEFHYLDMRRFTRGSREYQEVYVPSEERFQHWNERCVDHV